MLAIHRGRVHSLLCCLLAKTLLLLLLLRDDLGLLHLCVHNLIGRHVSTTTHLWNLNHVSWHWARLAHPRSLP